MLTRQNFGGHHQGPLGTGLNGSCKCQQCHQRFARPHITLQETDHPGGGCHVAGDFGQCCNLGIGGLVGEGLKNFLAFAIVTNKCATR